MTDVFTKSKRSEVMSNIRGKGNKSTEIKLLQLFKENGIKGWRRHQPLPGKPDFIFPKERLAVFVDGCFWHACPRCYIKPKQNAEFWRAKIGGNKKRDQRVAQQLRRDGWSVCRIWECRLKKPDSVIRRINRML
jgi:DNA mismatch endonuclease, patch repair protein